jgi:hypothetical protein
MAGILFCLDAWLRRGDMEKFEEVRPLPGRLATWLPVGCVFAAKEILEVGWMRLDFVRGM